MTNPFGELGDVLEGWHRLSSPPSSRHNHNYHHQRPTTHSLRTRVFTHHFGFTHTHDTQNCTITTTLFHPQPLPLIAISTLLQSNQVDAFFVCLLLPCHPWRSLLPFSLSCTIILYFLSVLCFPCAYQRSDTFLDSVLWAMDYGL